MLLIHRLVVIVGGILLLHAGVSSATAAPVQLAVDGRAVHPIVVGSNLSTEQIHHEVVADYGQAEHQPTTPKEHILDTARILADYLGRMGNTSFDIREGDGRSGIAIGLFSDFPALDLAERFDPDDLLRTEEYLIRSHAEGLLLVGATELAVEHAVWDLLHRLGYRQYFPGEKWEVVPSERELAIDVDTFESPDYHSRLIWYGGAMDYNRQAYRDWTTRNRAVAGFRLNTSHEYGRIQRRNKEAFAENPEFYALVNGERPKGTHAKFSAAHPGLQELIRQDTVRWFEENPHAVSKSMDPSDFGGWPTEGPSHELGSPSDQAVTLANIAAEAANEAFPAGRYIGMYAYYAHQLPPEVAVHPNVIVSIATRFLRTGATASQLMDGWRKSGVRQFGVREYYSVYIWDYDVPNLSVQGGSLRYLQRTIPDFHRQGARFLTAEASDNWGPAGLGYYVASRMLWDVREADRLDEIVEEFLELAFGPAQEPMRAFYALINGDQRPLLRDNPLYQMYSLLGQARQLAAGRDDVLARIDDLVLYTRFLELYTRIERAPDEATRQQAYEDHIRHAYRMRETMMIHLAPLYGRQRLRRVYSELTIPAEAGWDVPEDRNPWKSSEPFGEREIVAFIEAGIQAGVDPRATAEAYRLVARSAQSSEVQETPMIRESATVLLHAQPGEVVELKMNNIILGFSEGPAFLVRAPSGDTVLRGRLVVGEERTYSFRAEEGGVYLLAFEGSPNGVKVRTATPMGILAVDRVGTAGRIHFKRPRTRLYFNVPAGLERVQVKVIGQGKGEVVDATLFDATGVAVDSAAKASGEEPATLMADREGERAREVWSIELAQPASGYFGDAFLQMGEGLTPVLSLTPESVFEYVLDSSVE